MDQDVDTEHCWLIQVQQWPNDTRVCKRHMGDRSSHTPIVRWLIVWVYFLSFIGEIQCPTKSCNQPKDSNMMFETWTLLENSKAYCRFWAAFELHGLIDLLCEIYIPTQPTLLETLSWFSILLIGGSKNHLSSLDLSKSDEERLRKGLIERQFVGHKLLKPVTEAAFLKQGHWSFGPPAPQDKVCHTFCPLWVHPSSFQEKGSVPTHRMDFADMKNHGHERWILAPIFEDSHSGIHQELVL